MAASDEWTESPEPERKNVIDLGISADWEYDGDFIRLVEEASSRAELTVRTVWPEDLNETLQKVSTGELEFKFLFDRASATSPEFLPLQTILRQRGREVLDPVERLRWVSDKATMHLEFIANGLNTPYTVILPPYNDYSDIVLSADDLAPLGSPFFIKPANTTGGSLGVVDGGRTMEDIASARRHYPTDKYLLQEKIEPHVEDGRRFWFRGFFILDSVRCAWWNDQTHFYAELLPGEMDQFGLRELPSIVRKIASVSGVRFFSTEIVRDGEGRYVVVDYVNESCDMRLQSQHVDGVPDRIVADIASRIAAYIHSRLESNGGEGGAGPVGRKRPFFSVEEET